MTSISYFGKRLVKAFGEEFRKSIVMPYNARICYNSEQGLVEFPLCEPSNSMYL